MFFVISTHFNKSFPLSLRHTTFERLNGWMDRWIHAWVDYFNWHMRAVWNNKILWMRLWKHPRNFLRECSGNRKLMLKIEMFWEHFSDEHYQGIKKSLKEASRVIFVWKWDDIVFFHRFGIVDGCWCIARANSINFWWGCRNFAAFLPPVALKKWLWDSFSMTIIFLDSKLLNFTYFLSISC